MPANLLAIRSPAAPTRERQVNERPSGIALTNARTRSRRHDENRPGPCSRCASDERSVKGEEGNAARPARGVQHLRTQSHAQSDLHDPYGLTLNKRPRSLSLLAVVARQKPDENIRAFREYCRIRSLPAAARNPISAGGRYQERETGVENALTFAMRSKLSRMARPSSQNLPRRDFCLAFNANEPTRGLSLQIKPKLTCLSAIDRLSF